MRTLITLGFGLAILVGISGCTQDTPPTRQVEGNRGPFKPGGARTIKTGEPQTQPAAKKP